MIAKISSSEIFSDLIFDRQGNYIILRALMSADIEKRNNMNNSINNLRHKIIEFPNGNYFLNKVDIFLNKLNYKDFKNENSK